MNSSQYSQSIPGPSNEKKQQKSNANSRDENRLVCVVCGAEANGYNFDAVTCESCKAFFRRNAFRSIVNESFSE